MKPILEQIHDSLISRLEEFSFNEIYTLRKSYCYRYVWESQNLVELRDRPNLKIGVSVRFNREGSQNPILILHVYNTEIFNQELIHDDEKLREIHRIERTIDVKDVSVEVGKVTTSLDRFLSKCDDEVSYMNSIGYTRTGTCEFRRKIYEGNASVGQVKIYKVIYRHMKKIYSCLDVVDREGRGVSVDTGVEFRDFGMLFTSIQSEHWFMRLGQFLDVDIRLEIFSSANDLLKDKLVKEKAIEGIGKPIWGD